MRAVVRRGGTEGRGEVEAATECREEESRDESAESTTKVRSSKVVLEEEPQSMRKTCVGV